MPRFIVGDIHGSYDRLMTALDLCKFSDSDTLYCTGDIGDRGPDVRKCIDFLMSLKDRFKSVIGNFRTLSAGSPAIPGSTTVVEAPKLHSII